MHQNRAVFLLVKCISQMVVTKHVVTTNGNEVLCIPPQDTSGLAPCNHEEVDTLMFVHLADAETKGFNKVLLHIVDTDVIVLAVAAAVRINVQELWVAFGTAKSLCMTLLGLLAQASPLHYQCFMPIPGVTRFHHLAQRERRQHGSLG